MTSRPLTSRAKVFLIASLAIVAALIYPAYRIVPSIYWQHRIASFIRVTAYYPGCTNGHEGVSRFRCECEFVFEGEKDQSKLIFEGPELQHSYDSKAKRYSVSGIGTIQNATNRIEIKSDRIVVNGTEIPADRPSSFRILIGRNGELKRSVWDVSW